MVEITSTATISFGTDESHYSPFGLFRIFAQDSGSAANIHEEATLNSGGIGYILDRDISFPIYYQLIGGPGTDMGTVISDLHDALENNNNVALAQNINFNMPGSQGYNPSAPSYTWDNTNLDFEGHFSGDNLQGNMYTIRNSTVRLLGDVGLSAPSIIDHLSLKNFNVEADGTSNNYLWETGCFATSISGSSDGQSIILGANLDTMTLTLGDYTSSGGFLSGYGDYGMRDVRGTNLSLTSSATYSSLGLLNGWRGSYTAFVDKNIYTTGSIHLTGDFSNGQWAYVGGITGGLQGPWAESYHDTGNLFSKVSITFDSPISRFDNTSVGGLFGVYAPGTGLNNDTGLPDNAWSSGDIIVDGTTYGLAEGDEGVGQSFGSTYFCDTNSEWHSAHYLINGTGESLDGRRGIRETNVGIAAIDSNYMFAGFYASPDIFASPPSFHHVGAADPGNISNFIGNAKVTSNTGEHSFDPHEIDGFVLPSHESIFKGSGQRSGDTGPSSDKNTDDSNE